MYKKTHSKSSASASVSKSQSKTKSKSKSRPGRLHKPPPTPFFGVYKANVKPEHTRNTKSVAVENKSSSPTSTYYFSKKKWRCQYQKEQGEHNGKDEGDGLNIEAHKEQPRSCEISTLSCSSPTPIPTPTPTPTPIHIPFHSLSHSPTFTFSSVINAPMTGFSFPSTSTSAHSPHSQLPRLTDIFVNHNTIEKNSIREINFYHDDFMWPLGIPRPLEEENYDYKLAHDLKKIYL